MPRLLAFALLLLCAPASAAEPIEYALSFAEAAHHYVDVELRVPTAGEPALDLMLPVWTPGSYVVRDYAGHMVSISAQTLSGRQLPITKTTSNRWRVTSEGAKTVRVRYRLFGRIYSVRTNQIEDSYALIVPAATFLTPVERREGPYDVRVRLPKGWRRVSTGLSRHPDGARASFRAPDFDALMDAPLLVGAQAVYDFKVGGKAHQVAFLGEQGVWDGAAARDELAKLVAAHHRFWGVVPYERFTFMDLRLGGRGGLEHRNSTVVMGSPFDQRDRKKKLGWFGLLSHEYFHTWNVKRLRPIEYGPFDYEGQTPSRSLWIAEGITSYFDSLLVRRANLSTDAEYLTDLSKAIDGLSRRPGRGVQSLAEASFDAWVKAYKPDEDRANTTVSYYRKGSVVAWLLDARIRVASKHTKTLDDVMRLAYERFSGTKGYPTEAFHALATEVAGADLSSFFEAMVFGTKEPDYAEALQVFGVRFKAPTVKPGQRPKAWLGVQTHRKNGRLLIKSVEANSPAWTAKLDANDELIAVDGFRIADGLEAALAPYAPNETVRFTVARRGKLRTFGARLADPISKRELEVDPMATTEQKARFTAWLKSRAH